MALNLYKISQDHNSGYDTYSDAVVAAESADDAKTIDPASYEPVPAITPGGWWSNGWSDQAHVTVELIGRAEAHIERGVVCASFHAG